MIDELAAVLYDLFVPMLLSGRLSHKVDGAVLSGFVQVGLEVEKVTLWRDALFLGVRLSVPKVNLTCDLLGSGSLKWNLNVLSNGLW